mgnify:CR=1 FL=1|tara:strand:- start:1138 stop:1734 length:597 start_codon:yes stop_codon:yes gene_type:complete
MSCLLYVDEEEANNKISIDDLYEKKHQRDLKQISIFNKLLNRIHKRIQITGRTKKNEKHIWFTVPEYLFGEPNYDQGDCLGYLIAKLEDNGFYVKYLHPNTLFISWENWIPTYARNEFKKKTGIVVDERGNIIDKSEDAEEIESHDPNARLLNIQKEKEKEKEKEQKQYTSIKSYKPTGNLVYDQDMLDKIEKKVTFS